jgi:hypothetical protein
MFSNFAGMTQRRGAANSGKGLHQAVKRSIARAVCSAVAALDENDLASLAA